MAKTKKDAEVTRTDEEIEQEILANSENAEEAITEPVSEATVAEETNAEPVSETTLAEDNSSSEEDEETDTEAKKVDSRYQIGGMDSRNAIRDAIIQNNVLTGVVTGAGFIHGQVCVEVTYPPDMPNPVTVHIGIDRFGLFNLEAIKERVISDFKASEIEPTDEMIMKEYNNQILQRLVSCYNARIAFLPIEYIEERDLIFGDRLAASKKIRKINWQPTENRPVPKQRKDTIGIGTIIAKNYDRIIVSYYGYECPLRAGDISPLAVDLRKDYCVGENIQCRVLSVADDYSSIKIRPTKYYEDKKKLKSKLNEYHFGDRITARIIRFLPKRGVYVLRLPNGVAGLAYTNSKLIYAQPRVGDIVQCYVQDRQHKDNEWIYCRIQNVITR